MKMLNKIIGSSIAIAAALAFSASTTQAQPNLLVNPGFDNAALFTANPIPFGGINQGWALFGATSQNNMFGSPVDSPLSDGFALLEAECSGQ